MICFTLFVLSTTLNKCFMLQLSYQDQYKSYYFNDEQENDRFFWQKVLFQEDFQSLFNPIVVCLIVLVIGEGIKNPRCFCPFSSVLYCLCFP